MLPIEFSCILLAGGKGERFGSPKQYELLKGKEVWLYAYEQCCKVCDDVIVVGRDVPAGDTRSQSVMNGLEKVMNPVVVIVEAARPLVTATQIETIASMVTPLHPSWAFNLPANYTIYHDSLGHLNRQDLSYVQVPQAFLTTLLRDAYRKSESKDFTSETMLMEKEFNIKPMFLFGSPRLHKITYKEDLKMIEGLL
jgi:2-C-methyl-D-erythritol 4-phosphate cytidylyltransferase